MFEVFGNMDSVEEINACAAGLLEEGDTERIGEGLEYVEKRTGELVRKGITNCPDLTVFHWARDYYLEDGEE